MERTGHRTQCKYFVVLFLVSHNKHTVSVMVPVTGYFVKVGLRHIRSFGQHVTSLFLFVFDESLQNLEHLCALRHKERQTLTDIFIGHKDTHISAEFVMVAFLCLFNSIEISLQVCFFIKSGTVNSRKHFVVLVTSPVCACKTCQLESLDHTGKRQMRTRAQIDEITLLIERYLFAFGQIVDKLHLVIFAVSRHKLNSFVFGQNESGDRIICLDNILHFLLYLSKLFGRDRSFEIKIVIESVGNSGSYSKFYRRENILDSLREYMRAGMSVNQFSFVVRKGKDFKLAILVDDISRLNDFSVYLCSYCRPR